MRARATYRLQHTTNNVLGLVGVLLATGKVLPLILVSFPLALDNNHWFLNAGTKTLSFLMYLILC